MREEVKKRALSLLDKRDYSRRMLHDKLTEKGATDAEADEVCGWLCELGAVNDERYAELVVRHYAAKGFGPRRIREELFRRGIEKDLWETVMEELPESDDTVFRLLCQKLRGTECSREDLQRAQSFLLRRGYSWEEIRPAMERYQTNCEDDL